MTPVVLFLRAPVPGACKTRLIPALGPQGAAALARAMAADVIALVASCGLPLTVVVDGPLDAVAPLAGPYPVQAQVPGDLGARLRAALPEGPGLALGGDSPTLPAELLRRAAALESELVLGPAFDGGYTLLAWRRALPAALEGIPWSTPAVLSRTVAQARAVGVEPTLLPFWYDVDTPEDLTLLQNHLSVLPPTCAPSTRAVLRALE